MGKDSSTEIGFWASVAEASGGGAEVTVLGELDLDASERMRSVLETALGYGGDVEVDLRGCRFIDSSGIAALVWAAWQLKEDGRKLRILGARPRVRGIFDLTGLTEHDAVELEDGTRE